MTYTDDGRMVCPKCLTPKKLGTGGVRAILKRHYGTEKCIAAEQKLKRPAKKLVEKKEQSRLESFKSFWGPKKAKSVASTVAPPPVISSVPKAQSSGATHPTTLPAVSKPGNPSSSTEHVEPIGYRNTLRDLARRLVRPAESDINDFLAVFKDSPLLYDCDTHASIDEVWEESVSGVIC